MARLRKELKDKEQQTEMPQQQEVQPIPQGAALPAGSDADDSIEYRLTRLKSLYEKKLITGEEYEAKRMEILGDL